jgi:hypothetical protein
MICQDYTKSCPDILSILPKENEKNLVYLCVACIIYICGLRDL